MTTKPKIRRQPIDISGGFIRILRPGAFYWHAGRLYVGYARLSRLHPGEEPMWDPVPLELGTIVETRGGFYQFTNIQQEGQPYRRLYASLNFAYLYRPNDFGSGFLRRESDQGAIEIHERYVLAPATYLECQWLSEHLLTKSWRDPRILEPRIRKSPSLEAMRKVGAKDRRDLERDFSQPGDRAYMIARYAVE